MKVRFSAPVLRLVGRGFSGSRHRDVQEAAGSRQRSLSAHANPVARAIVRRYGKFHDKAFERDALVVGLLTAA
jgi:hypothetical protein